MNPATMNWHTLFPGFFNEDGSSKTDESALSPPQVEFADVGCGYGGLLGTLLPFALCIISDHELTDFRFLSRPIRIAERDLLDFDWMGFLMKSVDSWRAFFLSPN